MKMEGDNGFNLNVETLKALLLAIYEHKPDFPIENKDVLIETLGGINKNYHINDQLGDQPVKELADRSFDNLDNIEEPNQIIDSILGESYINVITKVKVLEKLNSLTFPFESKDKLLSETKDLMAYGVPIDTIADKLDYPVEKSEQILNRLKILDKSLVEVNENLINNLMTSEQTPEAETKPSSDIIENEEDLREKLKKIIEMGKNAYRENEYNRSIEIYDEGLALDPENTELRFLKKTVQAKIADMTMSKSVGEIDSEGKKPSPGEAVSETTPDKGPESTTTFPVPSEAPEIQEPIEPVESGEPTEPTEPVQPSESTSEPDADQVKTSEPEPKQESQVEVDTNKPDSEVPENKTFADELNGSESKIELLEKKLQEKVQALREMAKPKEDLPPNACKSCEGLGKCYWCKGSGECTNCNGSGKIDSGEECTECKGSGTCPRCSGSGDCHWCKGTGKKES
jgi:hypothetical protein